MPSLMSDAMYRNEVTSIKVHTMIYNDPEYSQRNYRKAKLQTILHSLESNIHTQSCPVMKLVFLGILYYHVPSSSPTVP